MSKVLTDQIEKRTGGTAMDVPATGKWPNTNIATGIDAVKLADGSVTNTELQYINTLSSNAQTQITARLPLAGGTMSGATIFADQLTTRPLMKDYAESVNAIGTKTAAFDIDFEDGNVQSLTLSGAGTFNIGIVNALASQSNSMSLILTNPGAVTLTLVAGTNAGGGNPVKYGAGTAPTWTASGVDILTLTTFDGGTNYYGFQVADAKAP
jgi:hypothetical protein|tara:strand:+ start:1164 stop:1793 length:630 start_codon:yes stop_codon:yes gene_type:complete